jgi:ATP-binding cassette subfamily A (ABC1) protein 3
MYIMGMKGINYYFSWFCRYFFVFLVLHLLGSAIVVAQLKYIKYYMVLILFILFDIVLIVQNFFIQVFLSRAKIGVVISLLFFILQFVISFIATASNNPTIGVNAATSIIPHAAFVLAFQTILYA